MPNWCNNTIRIRAEKSKLDEFEAFLNENEGKDWFTFFRPLPEDLLNEGWYGWYEWSINNGFDTSLDLDRIDASKGYPPDNCQ